MSITALGEYNSSILSISKQDLSCTMENASMSVDAYTGVVKELCAHGLFLQEHRRQIIGACQICKVDDRQSTDKLSG